MIGKKYLPIVQEESHNEQDVSQNLTDDGDFDALSIEEILDESALKHLLSLSLKKYFSNMYGLCIVLAFHIIKF